MLSLLSRTNLEETRLVHNLWIENTNPNTLMKHQKYEKQLKEITNELGGELVEEYVVHYTHEEPKTYRRVSITYPEK